ncbi:hypothetical protein K438DRAFT_1188697 [Mycena galopus ATCC 62051]|nr:hypothetical protein K438DRAFT_1188697 [Mycena galopus ATCC 62051]
MAYLCVPLTTLRLPLPFCLPLSTSGYVRWTAFAYLRLPRLIRVHRPRPTSVLMPCHVRLNLAESVYLRLPSATSVYLGHGLCTSVYLRLHGRPRWTYLNWVRLHHVDQASVYPWAERSEGAVNKCSCVAAVHHYRCCINLLCTSKPSALVHPLTVKSLQKREPGSS